MGLLTAGEALGLHEMGTSGVCAMSGPTASVDFTFSGAEAPSKRDCINSGLEQRRALVAARAWRFLRYSRFGRRPGLCADRKPNSSRRSNRDDEGFGRYVWTTGRQSRRQMFPSFAFRPGHFSRFRSAQAGDLSFHTDCVRRLHRDKRGARNGFPCG